METITALETANLFKISREAVRKYCLEFDTYLSPVARPQKGRQRMFTLDDLEVIALIIELKGQGKIFTDIHGALANGQRGSVPEITSQLTIQPNSQQSLQAQITDLTTQLGHERALRHKAEGQVELLEKQLEKLQERLFKREW